SSHAARFDAGRLYLTSSSLNCDPRVRPESAYQTPLAVFDVSNPQAPVELGSTEISGQISLIVPDGQNLFILGNDYRCGRSVASPLALAYLDMSDPAHPRSLGTADFGKELAFSSATSTFKAFTVDDADGLVALPFSDWDPDAYAYDEGVQLIAFDAA